MKSLDQFIAWQRVPAATIPFKSLRRESNFLLAYAVFYVLAGYALGLVILQIPLPILGAAKFNQDVWYSIVFKIVLLLIVPAIVYFGRWGYTLNDLLLGFRPTAANTIGMVLVAIAGFFLNASHIDDIQATLDKFSDRQLRVGLGIFMPLVTAAIPEEFFFRGYLQTRLEKRWNRLVAILVATILFTAWHLPSRYLLSQGVEGQAGNLGQVLVHTGLPVFVIGLFFAWHWSRYRNLVLLVITHWAIDILPAISSYLKVDF